MVSAIEKGIATATDVFNNPLVDSVSSLIINDLIGSSFITNITLINMVISMLNLQKYAPVTSKTFKDEYDYVIVGAGSAGSTLAARLSELKDADVLLLEAGSDPPIISEVPIIMPLLLGTEADWGYRTVPQKNTGAGLKDKRLYINSGKTLGGSSTINAMLYVRGNKKNYDDWAAGGATGWSYDEVLPYFKKLEDNRDPEFVNNFGGEGYHNFSGPITAMQPPYRPEIRQAALDAAVELGHPIVDSNGKHQKGFYPLQATIREGLRCSTAKGYLAEVDDRKNLDIVKDAFVTKVIIQHKKAVGVEVFHPGNSSRKHTVRARREVILSAGAMNTPKLLMLSGIGPKEELKKHKIHVVADLPVGFNLHDHLFTLLGYDLSEKILPITVRGFLDLPLFLFNASGAPTSPASVTALAFLSKHINAKDDDLPDYELYFVEGASGGAQKLVNMNDEVFEKVYLPHVGKSIMWCFSQLLNTRSRGTVTLNSTDPRDPPIVDPNYLADPDDFDDVLQGMKKCNEVARTKAMQKIGVKRWTIKLPGCEQYEMDSDEYLRCHLRTLSASIWHPVGTAKMGRVDDPTTVVDPKLRVKGVKSLRVVDASVMPQITSGNPNVPVIMIAEKAADIIKESIKN